MVPPISRSQYFYAQSLIDQTVNINGLHQNSRDKGCVRGHLDEYYNVETQISFELTTTPMMYCIQDLASRPHGTAFLENKYNADTSLILAGSDLIHFSPQLSHQGSSQHEKLCKISYSDCPYMIAYRELGAVNVKLLIDYIVRNSRHERDASRNSWFVDFGFSRPQKTSDIYSFPDGTSIKMPFFRPPPKMDSSLQTQLGVLFSFAQVYADHFLLPTTYDALRTTFFAHKFRTMFFPGSSMRFEYIYLSMRCVNEAIHRHCDYYNDIREGFSHAVVYSFVDSYRGKQYRVSIVMTYRRVCGAFVNKFNEKSKDL